MEMEIGNRRWGMGEGDGWVRDGWGWRWTRGKGGERREGGRRMKEKRKIEISQIG